MDFELGDRIRIEKDGNVYEGIVMPTTTDHVVVKMVSGYNAGIDPEGATITLLEKAQPKASAKKESEGKAKKSKKLPKVEASLGQSSIRERGDSRGSFGSSAQSPAIG